jgi:aspartyl protease family protein
MLVDTGATGIALSREDARSAGIATSIGMNGVVGKGADGSVHGEVVTVDRMTLGNANTGAVRAIVLNSGGRSLLGQGFLARFASVFADRRQRLTSTAVGLPRWSASASMGLR